MIRVLGEQTINQIAAGEVVENPASVVKELVENALDAGASEIRVEVTAAGRNLISVADNGCGIASSEAPLAFARHATSKIASADDLTHIATMGFRGEALAAIASVAKVTMITAQGEVATKVVVEGSQVVEQMAAARPRGTTIEARSLFYNAPVRRDFQKSLGHDNREIHRVMQRAALAHPEIGFWLCSDGKMVLEAPAGESLEKRARSLISSEKWLPVEGEVWGLVGAPGSARPSRLGQTCFVNGRPVVSPLVSRAVSQAFATRIPSGRFPIFVLHLSLPQESVDVNVHPQKKEVRFSDEEYVGRVVHDAVVRALTPKVMPHPIEPPPVLHVAEAPLPYHPLPSTPSPSPKPTVVQPQLDLPVHVQVTAVMGGYAMVEERALPLQWQEAELGWVIIDLKGIQQRLVYDALVNNKHTSEPLLIPQTIELMGEEYAMVEAQADSLAALGFSVRPFGDKTVLIEAVPASLPTRDAEQLLKEVLAAISDKGSADGVVKHQMALAAAQYAGNRAECANLEGAGRLVGELAKKESALQSPQGRPLMVRLGVEAIERRFRSARANSATA